MTVSTYSKAPLNGFGGAVLKPAVIPRADGVYGKGNTVLDYERLICKHCQAWFMKSQRLLPQVDRGDAPSLIWMYTGLKLNDLAIRRYLAALSKECVNLQTCTV